MPVLLMHKNFPAFLSQNLWYSTSAKKVEFKSLELKLRFNEENSGSLVRKELAIWNATSSEFVHEVSGHL